MNVDILEMVGTGLFILIFYTWSVIVSLYIKFKSNKSWKTLLVCVVTGYIVYILGLIIGRGISIILLDYDQKCAQLLEEQFANSMCEMILTNYFDYSQVTFILLLMISMVYAIKFIMNKFSHLLI